MSIKYVLFDLDGTLLPLNQDEFVKMYFGLLSKKMADHGYEPDALIKAIWSGMKAMHKNESSATNEEIFWNEFCKNFGQKARNNEPCFAEFYENEFQTIKSICGFKKEADEIIKYLKSKGVTIVLATNPVFPRIATLSRMRWAGLDINDFALVTTYVNSYSCKPNLRYYKNILEAIGAKEHECLMVGNDVAEDMIVESLGLKVFLMTDCLINKEEKEISHYPQGGFEQLKDYLETVL